MGFIADLITGQLFSEGVDSIKERIKHYSQSKDLSRMLDEYDKGFMFHKDTEIFQNNSDMGTVFEKRKFLISCAKDYLKIDNFDIKKNVKQEFIDAACKEIGDSSEVIKSYLEWFYFLVFTKETEDVSVEFKTLLNAYADSQHEINRKTDERILKQDEKIGQINRALGDMQIDKISPFDFKPYYKIVEEEFTEEKDGESIVGAESDENAYIDAYINKGGDSIPALPFLEEWFGKKKSGVILIYGEPGHGKTMLCNKAMVDFSRREYLIENAKNVISVSLNIGDNPSIIEGGKVTLSKSLAWGEEKEHRFSFQDCRGSLLFLDGFDEFIDEAKRVDASIDGICPFMKKANAFAKEYGIHIVVLSRTVAVANDLNNLTKICNHYELSPVSHVQQDEWLNRHPEYSDYAKGSFQKIRSDRNMEGLLGVPLLFRLIIHNRFDAISANVVELYNNLFIHLMNKRKIYNDNAIRLVEEELMNLAYEIYCTDSNTAVLENVDGDPHWLFTFYVKTPDKGRIGFFHRTFYQYYFAKYIYLRIITLKDDEEEKLIGLFAERSLDDTILQYLPFFVRKEDKSIVDANIERLIITLSKTEAYLNLEPHVVSGDAVRPKILRSTNIYNNVLKIAAAFSYVIQLPFKDNLDLLMRTYNSDRVVLVSEIHKRANLNGADLNGAHLNKAHLIRADLNEAHLFAADLNETDLRGANLRGAHLGVANLIKADLRGANLSEANLSDANLKKADLRGADLSKAELKGANLSEADLRGADLSEANLNEANLRGANLSKGNLYRANLNGGDLNKARLIRTNLTDANLSRANLIGAELKGANLRGANLSKANLNGANLMGSNLSHANLIRVDLNGANLIETDLNESHLIGADLSKAYLNGSNLHKVELCGACLTGADLMGADLSNADLLGTNLSKAHLNRTNLRGTNLRVADLSGAFLYKAKIDIKDKGIIDFSAEGYSSIEWIDDEEDKY